MENRYISSTHKVYLSVKFESYSHFVYLCTMPL